MLYIFADYLEHLNFLECLVWTYILQKQDYRLSDIRSHLSSNTTKQSHDNVSEHGMASGESAHILLAIAPSNAIHPEQCCSDCFHHGFPSRAMEQMTRIQAKDKHTSYVSRNGIGTNDVVRLP